MLEVFIQKHTLTSDLTCTLHVSVRWRQNELKQRLTLAAASFVILFQHRNTAILKWFSKDRKTLVFENTNGIQRNLSSITDWRSSFVSSQSYGSLFNRIKNKKGTSQNYDFIWTLTWFLGRSDLEIWQVWLGNLSGNSDLEVQQVQLGSLTEKPGKYILEVRLGNPIRKSSKSDWEIQLGNPTWFLRTPNGKWEIGQIWAPS